MAKAIGFAALAIGAVALIATGVGAVALGGFAGTLTVGGISASTLFLVSGGLSVASTLLAKTPKVTASQTERLSASVDPRAYRKTWFGQTAGAVDIRYEEWSGRDQEICDWIICFASHAIDGVEEIWFDTQMAWSARTGVVGKYVGYFSLPNLVLEGTPQNAFTFASGKWNANTARMTGCAYARFRFKVTGNSKKAESPFSSGIPSRITVIGRGAKLYDPRRDSTVPGGSGPMRADDQSTWRYTADDGVVIGENLPLQILRVVLGWRIRNPVTGVMKLATGSGVPARRISLPSFQIAANLADELVNRSAGGNEPRYHGAGVISEGDDQKTVLDMMCGGCCARFRDTAGKLALVVSHNDLASAAIDDGLNDDDVVGAFNWDPDPSLEATPNIVRGKYVDPTTASLYQLIDYPEVSLPSPDGQDRYLSLDLGVVESPSHAQRVAKQVLQRRQYSRQFSAAFDIRAWKYNVGDVLPFTFAPLGFTRTLFRVKEQELGQGGTCNMVLTFETPDFYQWDASDALPVQAAEPIVYDSRNNPLILAIDDAAKTATEYVAPEAVLGGYRDPVTGIVTGGQTVGMALASLDKIEPITLDVSDIRRAGIDQNALIRQADRDRAQLAAAQIAGLLDQQVTRITLRDAGLITDPESGRVYIYAVEQNAQKVSKVEIGLDAVTNEIALRATYNDVATMITQAQLSPGDAAELGELVRRVNVAEISISGMTAAIALKADAITVTKLGGIVQSVSQTLDALAGEVTTKVSYSDFTPVRDRVGTVEQLLQSYGDVSTYQLTLRQAELRGTAAAAAGIASLVSNADTAQRLIVRSAEIQQQLTVRMDEGDAAEATSRLALAAKVGANEAGLVEERQTRADAVSAQAKRTDLLTATVVDQGATFDARFISQAKAISDGDKAQADRTDILTATVTKLGQDITATFAQQAKAISDGDSASVTALTQLTARIGDFGLVSVQQAFSVLADRTGKLEGQYTLSIDTNGRLQGFKLAGSATGPATFSFIDTDLNMGLGRVIYNTGVVMQVQGIGFGRDGDLLEWFGPSMPVNACTRANARSYKTTDGNEYMGGSLSAGTRTNAVRSTMLAATAEVTTGEFESAGRARIVTVSLLFSTARQNPGSCPVSPVTPTVTVELFRGTSASGVVLATRTLTGSFFCDLGRPNEPGSLIEQISGAVTFTDNSGGTSSGYYVRLANRNTNTFPDQQILSLVSVEE